MFIEKVINPFYQYINSFLTPKGQKTFNCMVEDIVVLMGLVIVFGCLFIWVASVEYWFPVFLGVNILSVIIIEMAITKFNPSPFFYGVGSLMITMYSLIFDVDPIIIGFTLVIGWTLSSMSRPHINDLISVTLIRVTVVGFIVMLFLSHASDVWFVKQFIDPLVVN